MSVVTQSLHRHFCEVKSRREQDISLPHRSLHEEILFTHSPRIWKQGISLLLFWAILEHI